MKTTDIDRERSLTAKVMDIYRTSVNFQQTSDEIAARMRLLVYDSAEYKRLPQYRKHAVRAVYFALFHGPADLSIYKHLEYRMLGPDGKYYQDFDTWRALFPQGDASLISTGAHFWKGTEKTY